MARKKTVKQEVVHSPKYELVKGFYDAGRWGITAVRNAVVKGWITAEEFTEITGEVYA